MNHPPKLSIILFCILVALVCTACDTTNQNQTTAVTTVTPPPAQSLQVVPRPNKILDLMREPGEMDQAKPVLKIVAPAKDAVINGSVVAVRLNLEGDLKGYKPHKDPATNMGNHIHVILDNQPYEAYYELDQPFELRNVTAGSHTLRVFASRPWHESYKNDGSFQTVTFTVKGGGDASKPTTTNSGQTVANNNSAAAPPREGKDMPASTGGAVDAGKPLLTYSRPKGEYKGQDTEAVMIDFWLTNVKLKGDGGEYRVRYIIDDDDPKYIDNWEPIWLSGWTGGKHLVRLELIDRDQRPVDNGGYNTTTREITIAK